MSDKINIWVLEDDAGMQDAYEQLLRSSFQLEMFGTLANLKAHMTNGTPKPALLIADLALPDGSLMEILRDGGIPFPYLVVSSVDDIAVLRKCFEYGAEDYLTKPFSPNELLFKVERALANAGPQVTLNQKSGDVTVQGRGTTSLTSKEFEILSALYHAKNRTASRPELLERIWGKASLETKALDVHMHNLRRKVEPLGIRIVHRRPVDYILEFEAESPKPGK